VRHTLIWYPESRRAEADDLARQFADLSVSCLLAEHGTGPPWDRTIDSVLLIGGELDRAEEALAAQHHLMWVQNGPATVPSLETGRHGLFRLSEALQTDLALAAASIIKILRAPANRIPRRYRDFLGRHGTWLFVVTTVLVLFSPVIIAHGFGNVDSAMIGWAIGGPLWAAGWLGALYLRARRRDTGRNGIEVLFRGWKGSLGKFLRWFVLASIVGVLLHDRQAGRPLERLLECYSTEQRYLAAVRAALAITGR
jgi:hypothetical protein